MVNEPTELENGQNQSYNNNICASEFCIDCASIVNKKQHASHQTDHETISMHDASEEKLKHLRQADIRLYDKQQQYMTLLQQCSNSEDQLLRNKREIEKQIIERADEMCAIIENHKNHLLDQLKHICDENLQKYAHNTKIIDTELKNVKAVTRFSMILMSEGTDEDVISGLIMTSS